MRRLAFAVGDTAGHAVPALALADAFRARDGGARVWFFGTPESIAADVLRRSGESVIGVPGAPLRRAGISRAPRALHQTSRGVLAARRVLREEGIRLAVGFGGFASAGVLIAARTLGLATVIHEANVEPGLANALLHRFVDRSYATVEGALPGAVAVGLPVRASIATLASRDPAPPSGVLRLLVLSGSRGAGFLGSVVPEALCSLTRRGLAVEVLHHAGSAACEPLTRRYAAAGVDARVVPFIADMAQAYQWAHVAIARAGANTIEELAIAGLPAILVPLADAAADHQSANARRWEASGAGLRVAERDWETADAAHWLHRIAADAGAWRTCSQSARRLAQPSAALRMADDCDALMETRW